MKTRLLSFILIIASSGLFADYLQAPVPLTEDSPSRVYLGATGGIHKAPESYSLGNLGGRLVLNHYLGAGFEVGLGLRGGADSGGVLFGSGATNYVGGADLMLRFLGGVTDSFYLGVQTQVGYLHTFNNGMLDKMGAFEVEVGLPFSFGFGDNAAWLYVMPTISFHDFEKQEDAASTSLGFTTGAYLSVGTYINIGGPWLVLEATPKWLSMSELSDVGFEFSVGFAFDY